MSADVLASSAKEREKKEIKVRRENERTGRCTEGETATQNRAIDALTGDEEQKDKQKKRMRLGAGPSRSYPAPLICLLRSAGIIW